MRLTFATVVAVFRDQLKLGRLRAQYDLIFTILYDFLCHNIDYVLHPAAVSAWMLGQRPVSAGIVGYYCMPGGDLKMAATIAAWVLPHIPDRALAVDRLVALIRSDPTIHPETRDELLAQADDISMLFARTLIFSMARNTSYSAADLQDAA